jgi:UDP-N-acetylmuramoyl-tripeptide--D-alanyl-D-alanine ligase
MIQMTFGQIAQTIDGQLLNIDSKKVFSGEIKTDSKRIEIGDIFVAIKGLNFDGHDYVEEAIKSGAVAVLVSKNVGEYPQILVTAQSSVAELYSQPTIWALGKLAKYVHQNLPKLVTIAITGSSGKTSTKDLIAQLGPLVGETVYTKGSENNEIGLPLTIFNCTTNTKVLVLEMGARRKGNIKYLTDIAKPNFGIITHIGSAHLEIFGSERDLIKGKSEIISDLTENDFAVINFDDPKSMIAMNSTKARVISFGIDNKSDIFASEIQFDEMGFASFDLYYKNQKARVNLNLVGRHNIYNALAAVAPFLVMNIEMNQIVKILNAAEPLSKWRMQYIKAPNGVLIINDAYNANPESTRAALAGLSQVHSNARKIAVLGEMKELGTISERAHFEVGSYVAELAIDHLLVVGTGAKSIFEGAVANKEWKGKATFHENIESVADYAKELVADQDVVLVKASRSVGLEVLVEQLIKDLEQS